MVEAITLLLFMLLGYIYLGYLLLLRLLLAVYRIPTNIHLYAPIKVTVLITVHNEEDAVLSRISNVLKQDYPSDLIEVLVASDGSTDRTNELVGSVQDARVRLFVSVGQVGKTAAQNMALKLASGELLIFTDAGSRFASNFIRKITSAFADDSVGAVDGHLLFSSRGNNQIALSQGYYWRYELALREAESKLGILAVASGACLAVRRHLIKEMDSSIGEDCIVPLDVISQGYKVVHVSDAITYDEMENDPEREFRSRVRMTLRNWQGTWSRAWLLNPFVNMGYSFTLWSHKVLRWLSPFFLIAFTFSTCVGAASGGFMMKIAAVVLFVFYASAILGWISERRGWRIPFVHTTYSYILANAGFFVGVLKALARRKVYKYR